MTDDLHPLADAIARVSPETRALIDFLVDRPLAKRKVRSDDEKERWAIRDLRATVRYELSGQTHGVVVTLPDADKLLSSPAFLDRVWARLTSREGRSEVSIADEQA